MKVTGKSPNPMPNVDVAKNSGADSILISKKNKGASSGGSVGNSSRVDVSPRAQEMMKARELATPSGDIDEAKVARLQKLIDEGKYKVSAEEIADRLLDEHSKMPV